MTTSVKFHIMLNGKFVDSIQIDSQTGAEIGLG